MGGKGFVGCVKRTRADAPQAAAIQPPAGQRITFSGGQRVFGHARCVGASTLDAPYFTTEKVLSIFVIFPSLSLTDTVSFPFCKAASGVSSASSQTLSPLSLKRLARF